MTLQEVPLTGDRTPFPYLATAFDERQGQFSSSHVSWRRPIALFQTRVGSGPWSSTVGNLVPQYDVATDGRFLVNVTTEEAVSPITVILNWKPK